MAVQGPWVGSSYVAETGQNWASLAANELRVTERPFWISSFIGRSKEEIWEWTGPNHSFNKDWLIGELRNRGGTPVVINIRADQVSHTAGVPLFEFPGDLPNAYVTLNIYATIYGRGGNGGGRGNGDKGGDCIHNWIGNRLRINNQGWICGGGGGGGGSYWDPGWGNPQYGAGGGGRPFGVAPWTNFNTPATNGTLEAPGHGSRGGNFGGGDGGQTGANGGGAWGPSGELYRGGASGHAVVGTSPQWINTGNIAGPWL
ncbi:tail fiber protein [Salmonella phage SEA1]|nr:tail fiber protein [Salmonella phage SEA1]